MHVDEQRGFFGFFECIDDTAMSNRLFETAIDWLRERGMTAVRGPMNPSRPNSAARTPDCAAQPA